MRPISRQICPDPRRSFPHLSATIRSYAVPSCLSRPLQCDPCLSCPAHPVPSNEILCTAIHSGPFLPFRYRNLTSGPACPLAIHSFRFHFCLSSPFHYIPVIFPPFPSLSCLCRPLQFRPLPSFLSTPAITSRFSICGPGPRPCRILRPGSCTACRPVSSTGVGWLLLLRPGRTTPCRSWPARQTRTPGLAWW